MKDANWSSFDVENETVTKANKCLWIVREQFEKDETLKDFRVALVMHCAILSLGEGVSPEDAGRGLTALMKDIARWLGLYRIN